MFDFIVSLLYPKRCVKCGKGGAYICDNCFSTITFLEFQRCAVCQKGSIDGLVHPKCELKDGIEGILSVLSYKGIVKKLIYQFKYPPYLSSLQDDLSNLLYEGLIQQESFMHFMGGKNVVFTCVPLHPSRLKRRGYNQSELLAANLSEKFRVLNFSNLLLRKVNTKAQFDLKKEQRAKNVSGAFVLNSRFKSSLQGKRVVIVDDILTTGSTLRECAKVLRQNGAKEVLGVTLAHEDK